MAKYQKNKSYDIPTFRDGLNVKVNARLAKPGEAQIIHDVDFDDIGSIESRHDDEVFVTLPGILWMAKYGKSYLASDSSSLYKINSSGTHTTISNEFGGKMWSVEHGNYIYITNGKNFYKYDGSSFTQVGINPPVLAPVISLLPKLAIDYCEVAWTASANVTSALETNIYKQGSNSNKLTIASAFTVGLAAYSNITAVNLSSYGSIGFYIYSDTGLADDQIQIKLCTDNAGAVPVETINVPGMLGLSTWQYVFVPMVNPSNCTAIESLGIYVTSDISGQCILYLDAFEADGGPLNESYLWHYSYLGGSGYEGSMSEANTTTTQKLDRNTARLRLVTSADPQVEKIKIYRSGGTIGSTKFYIGEIENNPDTILYYTSGSTSPNLDNFVSGDTSGSTGIVKYVPSPSSGTWAGGDAVGYIELTSTTGFFDAGENVNNLTTVAGNVLTTRNTSQGSPIREDTCATTVLHQDDCADDDTADWTISSGGGTLAFDTDHYEWTNNLNTSYLYFDELLIREGTTYRVMFDLKDGTAAPTDLKIFFYDGTAYTYSASINTTGSFVTYDLDVTAANGTEDGGQIGLYATTGFSAGNIEIKNFEVYTDVHSKKWTISSGGGYLRPDLDHYKWENTLAGAYLYLTSFPVVQGNSYYISVYLKDGTATPTDVQLFFYDGSSYTYGDDNNITGTSTEYTLTVKAGASAGVLGQAGIYLPTSLAGLDIQIKTFTLYNRTPHTKLTTTLFYDAVPDDDLIIPAENESNVTPQQYLFGAHSYSTKIGKFLEECDGRLWMAKDKRLWISRSGAYKEAWPEHYFIDFSKDITGIKSQNETMVVFTEDKPHKIIGSSPDDYYVEEINWEDVVWSNDSVIKYRNNLIARGHDNLHMVGGDGLPVLVGEKIDGLWSANGILSVATTDGTKYYIADEDKITVMDMLSYPSSITFYQYDVSALFLFYDHRIGVLYYSNNTAIYKLSSSSTDIACDWKKNQIHMEIPNNYKYLRKILINYYGDLTLNLYSDGSSTADYTKAADTTSVMTRGEFSIPYNITGTVFDLDIDLTGKIEPPMTFLFTPCTIN